MLSDLAAGLPGTSGDEEVKKVRLEDDDPVLKEKATVPVGALAVHVFGCRNLFLDVNFPPEHYGIYVYLLVGSQFKCTSVQSPFKKGKVVWNEIRNFLITVSNKVNNPLNKVIFSVVVYDKLQPKNKHRVLGKVEFHLHKLVKKQWSMDTFELQNRRKQYAGDIQLEFSFAYGLFGYGFSDQLESIHPVKDVLHQSAFPHLEPVEERVNSVGVLYAPTKVQHPSMIPFNRRVKDLEPDISPTYGEVFQESSPTTSLLEQRMTRLNQLHQDYCKLNARKKRIHFLQNILQEKELGLMAHTEEDSASESSSTQDLGVATQAGLTGALAQIANAAFLAGAPGVIQRTNRYGAPRPALSDSSLISEGEPDVEEEDTKEQETTGDSMSTFRELFGHQMAQGKSMADDSQDV